MMKYSYNNGGKVILAGESGLNASFKDLCSVCDSIRHRRATDALSILEITSKGERPILYRRHNKYMGSRHELGGNKGRYPKKCAAIVRKVVVNAIANARNSGEDPDSMYVVHASANKTIIVPRSPPKGVRSMSGGYGYGSARRSNIELAKVEIGLAYRGTKGLGKRTARVIEAIAKSEPKREATKIKEHQKPKPKPAHQHAEHTHANETSGKVN